VQTFRQEVKDKDIEGALQLSNLSVTRWVARSESIVAVMWASLDGIIAALDKETESEDARTRVYKDKNQREAVKCFECILALIFMRNVMSKTKILTKQVQAIELNIADAHALEENINLQIEAAVVFSDQDGVNAESEFAKHHRERMAPRRIDDTPENAVHFGLQTFYRKDFLQVLDAQMLLLEDNLKVAFKIIEPAVSFLKPPYESKIISRDVLSLIDLFPPNAKPDEASLEVMDHSPFN
jgi:hypothetical protein